MKIAFIGPKEYSEAFSFLGFYCFSADNEKEFFQIFEEIKKEKFEVVFVSQDILSEEISGIVLLPGIVKKQDEEYLKKEITRAVGAKMPMLSN
ncbi:MAG: hypothetical protein PHH17_01010 [Candidatus Pacebacteria bacterium]|jgi:vacuolar-type H+-ATPase subunit F/Vma7|nr:hypothetical protein [Candidatus Paceibacterota bacterium]MDD3072307.1 hypothetical protein [Candidatus Paceibacterota bacterium]MDD4201466.1 hypothetical protein [Candidatus Paceibacterota bacterium]MDD4467088.1 hypothetical protein [Candidatus Paceibacterota bacterium]MDD4897303.1 hypothetical protein [Candidatus Paceibacterota bacterium]